MAMYRGWDHDQMLQAGNEVKEPDLYSQLVQSSLNPINGHQFRPTTITPQRTLRAMGLDSDSLYDLREDDIVPEISPVKSRKRSVPPKGRHVSLTRLWECVDEGDLAHHNNGPDFEEAPAKRKKPAPKKRSQSMKVPAKISKQGADNEEGGSQLSTPPKTVKRAQGRVGSLPPKGNSKVQKALQNTTITKPSYSREKEVVEPSTIEPVKSYQGFTTTEEIVKSASVSLSKTTSDRLASFRYKPSSQAAALDASSLVHTSAGLDLLPPGLSASHSPSSEQDYALNHQSFFGQATWHAELVEAHQLSNGQVGDMPTDHLISASERNRPHPVISSPLINHDNSPSIEEKVAQQAISQEQPQVITHSAIHGHSHDSSHLDVTAYDDPTSSEARLLRSLLANFDVQINESSAQTHILTIKGQGAQPAVSSSERLAKYEKGLVDRTEKLPIASNIDHKNGDELDPAQRTTPSKPPEPELTTVYDVTRLDENIPQRYQVEVERSDLDDYEKIPFVTKDFYESDEFDEGLDDEDLLGMIPDLPIPQTPLKDLSGHLNIASGCLPSLISHTRSTMQLDSTANRQLTVNGVIPVTNPNLMSHASHLRIIQSGSDDEFPMDQEEEEEMLKLPELQGGVNEDFIPPESVQAAFDDDYQYTRVFNKDLQFSPPSSPAKLSEMHDTDKSSPTRRPRQGVDLGASPAIEEEDWSFIRTDDFVQNPEFRDVPDPFRDSPLAAKQRTTIDLMSSSSAKRTMSIISKAPTCATQGTVSIIDDDSHEYEPLLPFARPEFPTLVMDRCPVIGLSAHTFLRTCFRIGEMFRVGPNCHALGLDAVIELFARVNFSSRESGTTKQHFQFLDLWHDRPPYPNGILATFKTTELASFESKVFLTGGEKKMARVIGRLKKNGKKSGGSWLFEIINIRETDWEEIRWTKRIVSGDDLAKKERQLREAMF